MSEEYNVKEAQKFLKSQIKFFESLIKHLKSSSGPYKSRALWITWVLNCYINNQLIDDVEKAMKEHMNETKD